MRTHTRFLQGGYAPVAVVLAITLVSAVALVFTLGSDDVAFAANSDPECSAANIRTGYVCKMSTDAGRNAVRDVCKNNNDLRIWIGAATDSVPSVTFNSVNPDPTSGAPVRSCIIEFCAQHQTAGQDAQWKCTSKRQYSQDEMGSAQFTRPNLVNQFGHSILEDRTDRTGIMAGDTTLSQVAQNLPPDVSRAILGAQTYQLSELNDTASILSGCSASASLDNCVGTGLEGESRLSELADWGCDVRTTATVGACQEALQREQARLQALAGEAQALSGQVGGLYPGYDYGSSDCTWNAAQGRCVPNGSSVAPPPGGDRCATTPRPADCPPPQPPPSTFDRTPPQPPPSQCSAIQRALGMCGAGQYGPYGAQQCGAMQQIISGCPNPFNPQQQQCGGLLSMLNRCPAGSYNPNNPSNPYNYPRPTCTIQASPTNIGAAGQATTLTWQSQNAQYASLSNSGQVGPSGSMTVYPQGPTTYVLNVVGYGNQQTQCQTQVTVNGQGGGGSGQPTAQISCQPLSADVGMQVGISFACQNAAVSAGSGFSTGGVLSGNATVTVTAPSLGQQAVTYGLTCSNQGVTHSAQCTVNVNKAAIVLVANPKTVESGRESNIGWVTSGMDSCVISSPTNQSFTDANASLTGTSGSAKTGALAQTTNFVLTCETKTGVTKTATTTVTVN